MPWLGWRVHFTRGRLQLPSEQRSQLAEINVESISKWLDARSVSEGSPCLFAPDGGYDLELNRYFEHSAVRFRSRHTAAAVAYDLADFLTFLWWHREPVAAVLGRMPHRLIVPRICIGAERIRTGPEWPGLRGRAA